MNTLFKPTALLLFFLIICEGCSNRYPLKEQNYGAVGTVIGREYCNKDSTKDYWLIAIASSSSVRQQYGDTLTIDGVKYKNVIKASGLPAELKVLGQKIGFDFKLSETASITTGCSVDTVLVYKLKLAELIRPAPASF